jgi:hypothetical protein
VKDQSLFILQNVAKAEKRGLWADPFPRRHGYTGERNAMPDLTALQQYTALVYEWCYSQRKKTWRNAARLLAMNVADYEMRYSALPREEQLMLGGEFSDGHAELVTKAMETMEWRAGQYHPGAKWEN